MKDNRVSENKVVETINKHSNDDSAIHLVARNGIIKYYSDSLTITTLRPRNINHKSDNVINTKNCWAKPKEDNYLHNNNMKVSGTTPEYNTKWYNSGNPLLRPYDILTMSNNKNEDSKGSTLNITKYNNSRSGEGSNHAERLHIRHTNVDTPSFEEYKWNISCMKSSDTNSKDKQGNKNTKDIKEDHNRAQMIENKKCSNKQQGNKYLQGSCMNTSDCKLGY